MIVGIVGSRSVGKCSCAGKDFGWMSTPEGIEHRKVCNALRWINRVRSIVGQLAAKHELELKIVSGGADGADTLAEEACKLLGVAFKKYEIQSGKAPFAERAHARNSVIVDRADMLVALFAPGPRTPGTSDTVRKALAKGIPVHVFHEGRWLTE